MTTAAPQGVLVLGMHRSGTSATAGALARLGFHMGSRLVPPAADNPKGYFEHADVVGLNDRLLALLGRAWDDVRALPDGWAQDSRLAPLVAEMREAVLPALTADVPWATKDPRMSRTLPLWRASLQAVGVPVACILVLRHPREVAASLAARDAMPSPQASLLWLRHVLEAAAAANGLPRQLITYDALLDAPARALCGALDALGMRVPAADPAAALGGFVDAGERHHAGAVMPQGGNDPWVAFAHEAYEALVDARDPWATAQALGAEFARRLDAAADWIATLGAATTAVRRAQARVGAQLLDAQQRADALQARCDEGDRALAAAEHLCTRRLDELTSAGARIREADAALLEAQTLVARYRGEAEGLQAALLEAQTLVAHHRGEASGLEAALQRAERLAAERLADIHATTQQLAIAEDAQRAAEGFAADRLATIAELDARLRATDAALAEASGLCETRLETIMQLQGDLRVLTEAKGAAEALALARLDELKAGSARLDAIVAELDACRLRLGSAEGALQRIRASRLWPAFARLSGQGAGPVE